MITYRYLTIFILFISINAFCQIENTSRLKLSDDFVSNLAFETDNGSIYLTDIKSTLSNTRYKFLLDNGCPDTFISESMAKDLNFKPKRKSSIIDIFDKREKLPTGRLDFIVGGVLFKNIKTVVLPDESFEADCDVNGIIGLNLIEKCIWSISLKNGISISSNISSFPTDKYTKQHLFHNSEIECSFLGGDTIIAFLDLGMETFFDLNSKYIDFVGTMKVRNAYSNQACEGAIFSYQNDNTQQMRIKSSLAMLEGFSFLGGHTIKNVIIDIDYSDYSFMTIGSHILKCFDIIFDAKNKKFYSYMVKNQLNQIKNYGFGYYFKNKLLIVNYIYENEPTDNHGIQLNDTITHINNKTIFEIIENVQNCELTKAVRNELYKNDDASIKISRLEKPILIQKEYLFKD